MRVLTLALSLVAVAVAVAEAQAAPTPADREAALRTRAGDLARQAGRLAEAADDYAAADALAPSEARLWARIEVLTALRSDEELAEAYAAYLARYPDGPRAAEVRARLAILRGPAAAGPAEGGGAGAVDIGPAAAEGPEGERPSGRKVIDEPWFWAVIGIGAVSLLVTTLVLAGSGGVQDPLPGDGGFVVRTVVEGP
ncbi:MAG: hypothetical protein ACFCGT_02260 [Sandaracinaceae bacterium]